MAMELKFENMYQEIRSYHLHMHHWIFSQEIQLLATKLSLCYDFCEYD